MNKPDYRVLWTWDMATYWDNSFFGRMGGCSGKNGRREAFLRDYKRLIDFSSTHHINGVVIWGAVRAHNDGFDQLKELVRYGRSKGVRVMPGVSAYSYGGVCYDPTTTPQTGFDVPIESHPFSLNTWLTKHPEYAAIDEKGKPYPYGPLNMVACPSRVENAEWFRDGIAWLYDEFDVDGIQVEVGDYAVCHCPKCTARRTRKEKTDYSVSDMLATYSSAVEISRRIKPNAWVICETYSSIALPNKPELNHKWLSMAQEDRQLLAQLPQEAILQWGVDKALGGYATQVWPEQIYTPAQNNILRIHAGSQWSVNGPADWGANLVWDMVKNARMQGITGVSIFGEESPFSPPNEVNYLAFEEASGYGNNNPDCNEALFYTNTLDPLFGGSGYAKYWRNLYTKGSMLLLGKQLDRVANSRQPLEDLTDDPDYGNKARTMDKETRLIEIQQLYNEAKNISATLSGEPCGRWSWLENKLWNIRYLLSTM